jgi:hypothetical protein
MNTGGFTPNLPNPDPASHNKELSRPIGKVYENKLQFDEAVQRLLEEFEKHPQASRGIFY